MPVAVITGASRGLGAAVAHALDERGWDVVVDARDADALAAAVGSSTLHACCTGRRDRPDPPAGPGQEPPGIARRGRPACSRC